MVAAERETVRGMLSSRKAVQLAGKKRSYLLANPMANIEKEIVIEIEMENR